LPTAGYDNIASGNLSGNEVTGNGNMALGNLSGNNVSGGGFVLVDPDGIPDNGDEYELPTEAGDGNIAVGNGSGNDVIGNGNLAIGNGAGNGIGADGFPVDGAIAVGNAALATTSDSIAIGTGAYASGDPTVAIGAGSWAAGNNSVALGAGATSFGNNSVALGAGSYDYGRSDTVSVGSVGNERTISNLAPGILNTDAVNMGQFRHKINNLDRDLSGGIAAAAAQMNVMPYVPGVFALAMSGASYNGQGAIGATISRWDCDGKWNLNGGVSYGFNDTPIFRGGVTYLFGTPPAK
jgi:Hep_Hag./YadA-like C-terminal region.